MSEPRRTALHAVHLARPARMVPFAGYLMPVLYRSVLEEHAAVRTAAGLFDISHMARVDLTGPGAAALLEATFTNRISTLVPGQVRYGLVCNEAGGVRDDILVTRWGPTSFAAVVNASNRDKILDHWHAHNTTPHAIITDTTDSTAMVAVQGPNARAIVASMLPSGAADLRYYFARQTTFGAQPCVVSRTGYTGEDGYELVVPAAVAEELWNAAVQAGAVPCGLGARDTLRLEAGMPLYGHELSEDISPLEAGLGWAVKLDKPFVGREALQTRPVTRQRVGLELTGKRAAREGCPVVLGERPVGMVTSGSYAPGVEKSLAMAYLAPEKAAIGTAVQVDIRGTLSPAVVVPLPFYTRVRS